MLKVLETAVVSTSVFPVKRVSGSTAPFHSLENPFLRRPRTFLVVMKHSAMKNPVKRIAR